MAEQPQGEWKNITVAAHLKGRRRDPKYFPAAGEICLLSGPNCDDADGFTWIEVEVLWTDELFVVTRHKDCWPTITKHELVLFEPKPDPLLIEARAIASDRGWQSKPTENGEEKPMVQFAIVCLRRGIEIGKAQA